MDNTQFDSGRRYDEDEVLIFSGQFAETHTANNFAHLVGEAEFETIRNSVADSVEVIMRRYRGRPDVPLPADLVDDMTRVAESVGQAAYDALAPAPLAEAV